MPQERVLPPHMEETCAAIAQLHVAHERQASRACRFVAHATAIVSRPRMLALTTALIAIWVIGNLVIESAGGRPPDSYPFQLLATVLSGAALYLAIMILIVQRHDDELAATRAQLTLELAMLSERKTAKIIALLEALRYADPRQSDQRDTVAEALAEPADPHAVLSAIHSAQLKAATPGLTWATRIRRRDLGFKLSCRSGMSRSRACCRVGRSRRAGPTPVGRILLTSG